MNISLQTKITGNNQLHPYHFQNPSFNWPLQLTNNSFSLTGNISNEGPINQNSKQVKGSRFFSDDRDHVHMGLYSEIYRTGT